MSAEQFFQVALLPQGEFARFLRAESGEREELLERLFGTRRFSEVESWLAQRAADAKNEVAAAEEQLRAIVARLCQAAGIVDEPESPDDSWRQAGRGGCFVLRRCGGLRRGDRDRRAAGRRGGVGAVTALRRRHERAPGRRPRRPAGAGGGRTRRAGRPARAGGGGTAGSTSTAAAEGLAHRRQRAAAAEQEAARFGRQVDGYGPGDVAQSRELRDEVSRLAALRDDAAQLPRGCRPARDRGAPRGAGGGGRAAHRTPRCAPRRDRGSAEGAGGRRAGHGTAGPADRAGDEGPRGAGRRTRVHRG